MQECIISPPKITTHTHNTAQTPPLLQAHGSGLLLRASHKATHFRHYLGLDSLSFSLAAVGAAVAASSKARSRGPVALPKGLGVVPLSRRMEVGAYVSVCGFM